MSLNEYKMTSLADKIEAKEEVKAEEAEKVAEVAEVSKTKTKGRITRKKEK